MLRIYPEQQQLTRTNSYTIFLSDSDKALDLNVVVAGTGVNINLECFVLYPP